MSATMSSLAAAAAVAILALSAGQEPPPAESAVLELERAWDRALAARDTLELGRLLADDYTMTDASGARLNRREYLMSIVRAPDMTRVKKVESDDLVVRVTGDKATVTGVSPVKGRPRGRGYMVEARYRFTDEWVLRDGRWRAVSTKAATLER